MPRKESSYRLRRTQKQLEHSVLTSTKLWMLSSILRTECLFLPYISKNAVDARSPYGAVCGSDWGWKNKASLRLARGGVPQSFRLCCRFLPHPAIQ